MELLNQLGALPKSGTITNKTKVAVDGVLSKPP
jgi:hypothetical protein